MDDYHSYLRDVGNAESSILGELATRGLLPTPCRVVDAIPNVRIDTLGEFYRGALIGTAIGDALGRPAEGRSPAQLKEEYGRLVDFRPWRHWQDGPRGTVTDDTQMTMCVAECLIANNGRIDPFDLAERFVAWLVIGRGKGEACVQAVSALSAGTPWHEAGVASAGNGAAMRAAPVGLVHIGNINALRLDAALSSVVTHADPMAVCSAVAHAWLVARLITISAGSVDPVALVEDLCNTIVDIPDPGYPERGWQYRPNKTPAPVRLVDRLAEVPRWLGASLEAASEWFYCGAFVLESLPMALWHFLSAPEDPEEAVVNAVMAGHDADTVASMTGAYAGAYLGDHSFPSRWSGDDLEFADELRDLAGRLLILADDEAGS
jgi:ADP-ribosylglycohydrolase